MRHPLFRLNVEAKRFVEIVDCILSHDPLWGSPSSLTGISSDRLLANNGNKDLEECHRGEDLRVSAVYDLMVLVARDRTRPGHVGVRQGLIGNRAIA